jgi:hypothetical protein
MLEINQEKGETNRDEQIAELVYTEIANTKYG